MSETANWSYTNEAIVYPLVGNTDIYGAPQYGTPYKIKCTWVAKTSEYVDGAGEQFLSSHEIYTEDPRPKYKDLISIDGMEREEIKSVVKWDMSFFGEQADIKLVI